MNRLLPDRRQTPTGSCLAGHAAVGAGRRPGSHWAGTGARGARQVLQPLLQHRGAPTAAPACAGSALAAAVAARAVL